MKKMRKSTILRLYLSVLIIISSTSGILARLCTQCDDDQIWYDFYPGCTPRTDVYLKDYDFTWCCKVLDQENPIPCSVCRPGSFLSGSNCTPCIDANCENCDGNASICKQCKEGFWLKAKPTITCERCPSRCLACNSSSKCTKCPAI